MAIKRKKAAKKASVKHRRRMSVEQSAKIDRRFDYVAAPTQAQTNTCIEMRANVKKLAQLFGRALPEGREKSLALTKLEEALFYAIASAVRPEGE